MTSARDDILGAVRRRLGRGADPARAEALRPRIEQPRRNLVPARSAVPQPEQVEQFVAMAREMAATVDRVPSRDAVPAAVGAFADEHGLARRLRLAPALAGLDWTGFETAAGRAEPADQVSVTPAFAGVAETGTLVLLSGPDSPTSLNFLPDNHVVVVAAEDVVGAYEDAWDRLRARGQGMPRTVNMITGPSRTGDIEQTIQLGAHGPRRLHVIVVDGRSDA